MTGPIDPVLALVNVRKSVREGATERVILAGVDLEVMAGEAVAVVGRSGSGKSTLLNVAAGLDLPTGGEVLLCGESLFALDEPGRARLRQRHVGFVFQSFHLLPTLTVRENIALPLELLRRPAREGRARADELLLRIGLRDRADAFPAVLSGGEQQRIAIARAVAARPAVVLADEPTGNLDDESAAVALDLLLELGRENRSALVVVTHAAMVAQRCARVLRLEHGGLRTRAAGDGGSA